MCSYKCENPISCCKRRLTADKTTFPVPVDHWSLGAPANVNAHCAGNAAGNGIGHFCFASAEGGQTVGIACDVKVVIHEFGHALLWDHVNSPNFGFAHSAGDSLAAIYVDPTSIAPDRHLTFPWPQAGGAPLDRRQDRKVADGWGWFGNKYNTQYNGEQVLSTTLFRLYEAVGGNSPHLGDRLWASRYVCYLIIKAIGTLTTTTSDPKVFATALMNADLTTTNFEGHPGGALHKVIRWAFEKQGLYQPLAEPGLPRPPYVTAEGNPEPVDVYIDDGRKGEYQYLYAFWESKDMWARRLPDGGATHQEPAVGRPNYMYVRVKNRGTGTANNVIVKAYHCNPGSGLAWPDHWSPMDTPQLPAPGPIPSGGEAVVGPFEWTPLIVGHECLLAIASANGDAGNDTKVFSPIPHSRFVPFDNNIGQRNVQPVLVIDWQKILEYLKKLKFQVINPFKRTVKVELVPVLPKILRDQNYWLFFTNPGGNKFTLGPFEAKQAIFNMTQRPRIPSRRPWGPVPVRPKPGILLPEELITFDEPSSFEEFTSGRPIKFSVVTLIDDQNMGGMTYILQPRGPVTPGREWPIGVSEAPVPEERKADIELIVETVSSQPGVKSTRVKAMTLEVEFED